MKQILVMMAAVVMVGCGEKATSPTPKGKPKIPAPTPAAETEAQVTPTPSPAPVSPADEKLIAERIVERVVRNGLNKPEGELTEADLEQVVSVDFGWSGFTDAGLGEVAKLQNLEELGLRGTKITDAGLKELAKLKNLTFLNLEGTKVTYAGMAELKKALPNCNIYSNPTK